MKKAVLNLGIYVPDSTVSKPSRIIFIVRGFVFPRTDFELTEKLQHHVVRFDCIYIQGGARNVIPLIVHITHFYYYKSI